MLRRPIWAARQMSSYKTRVYIFPNEKWLKKEGNANWTLQLDWRGSLYPPDVQGFKAAIINTQPNTQKAKDPGLRASVLFDNPNTCQLMLYNSGQKEDNKRKIIKEKIHDHAIKVSLLNSVAVMKCLCNLKLETLKETECFVSNCLLQGAISLL